MTLMSVIDTHSNQWLEDKAEEQPALPLKF